MSCREVRFDTALGACGIAWSDAGVTRLRLPGDTDIPGLPPLADDAPPWLREAVDAIRRLLAGEPVDMTDVRVDLSSVPPFSRCVLVAARTIPHGATMTYGALAAMIGRPGASRAVGQAMGRNPVPLLVPCHRVMGAGGRIGGFSAAGGVVVKRCLLDLESRSVRS